MSYFKHFKVRLYIHYLNWSGFASKWIQSFHFIYRFIFFFNVDTLCIKSSENRGLHVRVSSITSCFELLLLVAHDEEK